MSALLEVENLSVHYGAIRALKGISFRVAAGEVVALIGANGAGKSTALRTLSGLMRPSGGSIRLAGREIGGLPAHEIVRAGIAHVPEGRGIFTNLTVRENLELAGYVRRRDRSALEKARERVFRLFPRLKERLNQPGATLSGGEQQMLAFGRALMTGGRLLLMDEPSMGLAPVLVENIFEIIREVKAEGATILLVEQNAYQALGVADRAYVLETGQIALEGPAAELRNSAEVKRAYLGG
ncbi:MAG: ABC transporter ATP-binding protein [Candidatus Brocadiia bacterium]|jgi:branched-chain amino acid transport system ATP-binding protein